MALTGWIHRHRALTAFVAGVLLTLGTLGTVAYLVLSDQRRAARLLAATLSQALSREVRIERVTEVSPSRVVMRGVTVARGAGWPVDAVAETVEATGPLLAAARGDPAPLRLTVTRPTVTLPPSTGGAWVPWLEDARQALAAFLGDTYLVDVSVVGGRARQADAAVEFDLTLRKGASEAAGELTLRPPQGAPLGLTVRARMEGETARLGVQGRGRLAPLWAWLGDLGPTALGAEPFTLWLEAGLGPEDRLTARGGATVGDAAAVEGEATLADGTLQATLSRAALDLGHLARLGGLGWEPTGRAELSEVTVRWQPDSGAPPVVRAVVQVPTLALPAAGVGRDVRAEQVAGRLALEPAGTGLALAGDVRAARIEAGGVDLAPAEARYRLSLDARWHPARADLEALRVRLEGVTFQGTVAYDVATGRLDADVTAAAFEAANLVRRVAPGWLGPTDRLRLSGLRLQAAGLDPTALQTGTVRVEARSLSARRAEARVVSGRVMTRAELERSGVALTLDTEALAATLAGVRSEVPRVVTSARLDRAADGTFQPRHAELAARDTQGRDILLAELRPATREGWLAVSLRAPDLQRLDWLWPELRRDVNGSARLDVEVGGAGFAETDGRLALKVAEADLLDGKVSLRDLAAEIPLRRGLETAGAPPWGMVEIGELIGYGLVIRDIATPANVWKDRLNLNDLAYALYSGTGKGWAEVDLEPAGLRVRGKLAGSEVRIEEFMSAYGIRGGTMTGLARYELDYQYRAGGLGLKGHFEVPRGGTVNIEILNRLLAYAQADPTGILRRALANLRVFDYKEAEAYVSSVGDDIRVSMTLKGREQFRIFPARVPEINVRNMPLSFLGRQFPGS